MGTFALVMSIPAVVCSVLLWATVSLVKDLPLPKGKKGKRKKSRGRVRSLAQTA